MTGNLLKRLREFEGWDVFGRPNFVICDEAADRIELLEGILKRAVDGYVQANSVETLNFDWLDDAEGALNGTWPAFGVMPRTALKD